MIDEGYIKFNCNWIEAEPISKSKLVEINTWRNKLYSLGLIGAYPNGIGFGNISIRNSDNTFLITGSATGNIEYLNETHYVNVNEYNLARNILTCIGPIKASSESLSHAVIYECLASANAVMHIHNIDMWEKYMNNIPTTKSDVAYGTPEMATEIQRLFRESNVIDEKAIVMGGHREGIITFGKDLDEAGEVLLCLL